MGKDWFEIEKIDEKTFVISEYKHWEKMHSYLLLGENYALLIDSGLGIGSIKKEVEKLTDLPVKLVTTHVHWDHIGGHKEFDYFIVHKNEKEWFEEGIPLPLDIVKKMVVKEGNEEFPEDFEIDNYRVFSGNVSRVVDEGDIIDLGSRRVEVIHTPGHSPGHICLYEEDKGYLFCGDLIYKGTLFANYPSTDPKKYFESIKKILAYKVDKILPSHNDLNIETIFLKEVYEGFVEVDKRCGLEQGSGIFHLREFKIHI